MKRTRISPIAGLASLFLLVVNNPSFAQKGESVTMNLAEARVLVDSLDRQFAKFYLAGDSSALGAMYTHDASLNGATGPALAATLGNIIRYSIRTNSRHVTYTTTSLMIDGLFIVEVGTFDSRSDAGEPKGAGKYLVVWKEEEGHWKIYRDFSL